MAAFWIVFGVGVCAGALVGVVCGFALGWELCLRDVRDRAAMRRAASDLEHQRN